MNILLICPRSYVSYYSLFELYFGKGNRVTSPPLGLLTLAGLLPPEWTLRLVDENLRDVTPEDFAFADSVFIGAMLPQRDYALALVREAKLHGKHVVVGGPYASSLPEELLAAGCDVLVRGEAEQVIGQVIEAVETRRQGVVIAAETRPDLRHTPVPRYELLNLRQYVVMAVQTTRGCPHNCEFCDVVNLNGRIPRHKNPEQVINELAQLHRLGWRGMIFICDDNFIGSREYARELLRHIIAWSKSHGEPFVFTVQASIELARDKKLIDLMTEANISEVFVGVGNAGRKRPEKKQQEPQRQEPAGGILTIHQCERSVTAMQLHRRFRRGAGRRWRKDRRLCQGRRPASGRAEHTGGIPRNHLVQAPRKVRAPSSALAQPGLFLRAGDQRRPGKAATAGGARICRRHACAVQSGKLSGPCFRLHHADAAHAGGAGQSHERSRCQRLRSQPPPRNGSGTNSGCSPRSCGGTACLAPYRLKFWRQFITVRRKKPSRFLRYIVLCLRGDMVAKFTRKMQNRALELELAAPRA